MIIRRVGAAILAVDEFTGFPMTGREVCIRCRDGSVPIHKEGGYHVFWDNGEPIREFLIKVPGFLPEIIYLNTKALRQKALPTRSVYLIPSSVYPFPAGMTWREYSAAADGLESIPKHVQGSKEQGNIRELPWEGTEGILALSQDAGPARGNRKELPLKAPDGIHLRDRTVYLKPAPGEQGNTQPCRLLEESSKEGIWLLENPLIRDWKKNQTAICLSYRAMADEAGNCRIPNTASIKNAEKGIPGPLI